MIKKAKNACELIIRISKGILPGGSIGQAVCEGSFRRTTAADTLFDSFTFCFVPGTCISDNRFFNIFLCFP